MRFTLGVALSLALLAQAVLLVGLFVQVSRSSAASVEGTAHQLRDLASERVGEELERYLLHGEKALDLLERALRAGGCAGPEASESCLTAALLEDPNLTEVTLTAGVDTGEVNDDLETVLRPEGRRQLSLYRQGQGELCARDVTGKGDSFVARTRCRPALEVLTARPAARNDPVPDPTLHPTFSTPAGPNRRGRTFWSDLSYSQLDSQLPEAQQRVVVTALRAVEDDAHRLLGVLKVGLLAEQLRSVVANARVNRDPKDPYRIFIADDEGRLVTGLHGPEALVVTGEEESLRLDPALLPPEVTAAVAHPSLGEVEPDRPHATGVLDLAGRRHFVSFRLLAHTQGWRVGIVGPEDYYLGPLDAARRRMLGGTLGVLGLLFVGMAFGVRVIRRALGQIHHETTRIAAFDFGASPVRSAFADVRDTLFSLELAKTAVRAMGKYVPLALVQRLFGENREPSLGGSLREVTVFFSDIEGFTTLSEHQSPDVVAQWLGRYLEEMTRAVHAEGGTVDKFIGDSVMALWNAPTPHSEHPVQACRAALRCQRAMIALFASDEWKGRPVLVTRIGLHLGTVMVGHFGAPDRLSYTAIGDAVNLASRLEGLNKHYGTTVLASEDVYLRTREAFCWRKVDVVAVKGKSQAVGVYELLGEPGEKSAAVRAYEQAFALYLEGDFARARAVLAEHAAADPPARVLVARCAELEQSPPPLPWDGVSHAQSK